MNPTEAWSPSPEVAYWDSSGSGSGWGPLEELELCQAWDLPYAHTYIPALYLVAFAVGLLGNAFVVWLLAGRRGPRRLVDTFVLHLACGEEPSDAFQGLSLLLLLLTFVLPLGVTLFCYCSISRRLRRAPHMGRTPRNSLRIIFAIEGTFVGSWLPFSVLRAVFHLARLGALPLPCRLLLALRWGLAIATCLAFVNSCANPVIYLLLDRSFRARARREACGRRGRQARRISSASLLSKDDSSVFWGRVQTATTASAAR
ncbi:probable G-protein coupled receptor 25 [Tupaia chinensis]|uniref:probable G-protein coupled receptor 25 n=1 Tax=Tupaia chinensis TaxID=246437 RepID=UPI0003C9013C|nr:probable G-protein coupled receptor 25 [Tupaia chinensis]